MAHEFLGRGARFPFAVSENGEVASADGEEKVQQSILLVLGTAPGERQMRFDFGSRIHDHVFGPISAGTMSAVAFAAQESLITWEPRVQVEQVRPSADRSQDGVLAVFVDYRIRATNNRFNLVYPFFVRGFAAP